MNSYAFHSDTSADGIDTVVVGFNSNLCAVARFSGNILDFNDTVIDFRNFDFKEPCQEFRIGARHDDCRVAGILPHFFNDCTNRVPFLVALLLNLLAFRQDNFILVVHDKNFIFSDLIHLANEYFADRIAVFVVDEFFLKLFYSLVEILLRCDDQSPSKISEVNDFDVVLTNIQLFAGFLSGGLDINLCYGVDDGFHDFFFKINLNVPLFHIDNDVKLGLLPVFFPDHHSKNIFHNSDKDIFVDRFFANQ